MKQFCFTCHIEKPDPSKRESMIAPPMRNVQQHYKSTYPDKDEFVKAVVSWVNKPDENKVLMPGAVRHFNLMPPLPIGNDKLEKIAGALYDMNFDGTMNGKRMFRNHKTTGAKQKLDKSDLEIIQQINHKLQQVRPESVTAYRNLGKEVFDKVKKVLLNKKYQGETLQQIQYFFHGTEELMHNLMAVNTVAEGEKYHKALQEKFASYRQYFK
jgi:hypothetical protein